MQYLYNSHGEWIAFRDGAYVYDARGDFLGFMAEGGVDIADIESRYFASIYYGDRLYRKLFAPPLDARFPGYPGKHDTPPPPPFVAGTIVPFEADDVPELTAV